METKILQLFNRHSRRSFRRREIADQLGLTGHERKELTKTLDRLVRDGQLQERRGSYRQRQRQKLLEGVIALHEQGYGFFFPQEERQGDLFIPARHLNSAMDGDLVRISRAVSKRDGRPYGRVVAIVRRATETLLGVYHAEQGASWVRPLDPKQPQIVIVRPGSEKGAKSGQVVDLRIATYPGEHVTATGDVLKILGAEDDPQVDIEVVVRKHQIPQSFSAAVLQAADAVALPAATAVAEERVDLRQLPLVTIDGESAADFDDAVALRKEENNQYRLWVCIADVAHYVAADTAIDAAAQERGTSVYFPGHAIPMLPEILSSGVCSLKPHEERLVLTAEMVFDENGARVSADFYPARIRSRARLTYTQVANILAEPESTELDLLLRIQLREMARLSELRHRLRLEQGSLELDLPEREIQLDERGHPVAVQQVERTAAHRLIEEFMLAANEAVAEYLEQRQRPFLYRIHEPPQQDQLQDLQQLLAETGIGLTLTGHLQKGLQVVLAEVESKPEARLVAQQLLRSLPQARYSPVNTGHFGLASACYCHFTSPIRRYPDLVVHRVLKQTLAQKKSAYAKGSPELETLGSACSALERRAMAAERELFELRCCQVMEKHLGQESWGVIASVAEFGFFVALEVELVEGLVHVRSLQDDYYLFDPIRHLLIGERRRQTFKVGNRVRIRIEAVDVRRRRLDFILVGRAK